MKECLTKNESFEESAKLLLDMLEKQEIKRLEELQKINPHLTPKEIKEAHEFLTKKYEESLKNYLKYGIYEEKKMNKEEKLKWNVG
jgi:NADH:ubiquinone oxidoreductase subunit E